MNLLFVCGTPKSGTTYLQMILNAHPEISCPPEHQFILIYNGLKKLLEEYNKVLHFMDATTAKQGVRLFEEKDLESILAFIVELSARKGAGHKTVKWYGLKDNSLLFLLPLFERLFPEARFVCPIRDPRSVTVSSWYHNLRTDPKFLQTRARSKEQWAEECARLWKRDTEILMNFQKKNPQRILLIKYEDLRKDPRPHLLRLFEFLEVKADPQIIEEVIEATRFEKYKNGQFFRKASISDWQRELNPRAIRIIENLAGNLMKAWNYPIHST